MVLRRLSCGLGNWLGSKRAGFCGEAFLNTVWTLLCWFLSTTRPSFVAYEPVGVVSALRLVFSPCDRVPRT
jgi:hypothetical protein